MIGQDHIRRITHVLAGARVSAVTDVDLERAKGIAAGLPLAAVTGRAEIMDASHPGGLGGTFGGNPVACAAALATMRLVRGTLMQNAAASKPSRVATKPIFGRCSIRPRSSPSRSQTA